MAAWRHRVARGDDGQLHFVWARYRPEDPYQRCGLAPIYNTGETIEEMRRLARELLAACDEPVISLVENEREPGGEEDDEDDEVL